MNGWARIVLGAIIVTIILSCGPKSMVILVPDPDGSVGKISVSNSAGSVDIDQAHQHTIVRGRHETPAQPSPIEPAEVERLFRKALASQPPEPVHFILYFHSDSTELLPLSTQKLPEIAALVKQRWPTTVSVVGHSDTQGNKQYNLALSMRRAQTVQRQLVQFGVRESAIEVSSHGEENPLIPTEDNVANAKNRRVEVIVR